MKPDRRLMMFLAAVLIVGLSYVYGMATDANPGIEAKKYDCLVTLKNPFYIGNTNIESVSCIPKGSCNPLFYFSSARPLSLFGEQGTLEWKTAEVNSQTTYDIAEGGRDAKEFTICTKGTQLTILLKDDVGTIIDQRSEVV